MGDRITAEVHVPKPMPTPPPRINVRGFNVNGLDGFGLYEDQARELYAKLGDAIAEIDLLREAGEIE